MSFRLDIVEDKISELEDSSKESTQNAARRNKEIKIKESSSMSRRMRLQNMSNRTYIIKNKEDGGEVILKIY